MAPSSIPQAGFGVFTVKKIKAGAPLVNYPAAPSIAVVDDYFHYGEDPVCAHENYYWSSDGYTIFEGDEVHELNVNFGSLCNYHTYLYNVGHLQAGYDDSLANRFTDPTSGSFSYYNGQVFFAERDLEAGEEIFANYGTEWLESREGYSADAVPREEDFETAATIVRELKTAWDAAGGIKNIEYNVLGMVKNIASLINERVANILPKSGDELEHLTNDPEGNAIEMKLALSTTRQRDVEWIEKYGMCVDTIVNKKSTIPKAGRGAFAARNIKAGSLIIPAPLLQIADRSALDMYRTVRDEHTGELTPDGDEVVGFQLMLNYCFGDFSTSLLLCPSTNAILMNHCSHRKIGKGQCGDKGPNAEIRWASWDPLTDQWLNVTVKEISKMTKAEQRGLSFDFVAIRDIKTDDEIFIDYGAEWEDAFEAHIEKWEAPVEGDFPSYASISEMNKKGDFRTEPEIKENPYADNVMTACFKLSDEYDEEDDAEDEEGEDFEGYENDDEVIFDETDPAQLITSGRHHVLTDRTSSSGWYQVRPSIHKLISYLLLSYFYLLKTSLCLAFITQPCQILSKKKASKGKLVYTVRILSSQASEESGWAKKKQARIFTNFPKRSIIFVTKKHKSDQFLSNAFRHHIGMSSDMIPDNWKDLSATK